MSASRRACSCEASRGGVHYSTAEFSNLIDAANKVCQAASRKNPAVVLLRAAPRVQPLEETGRREGLEPSTPAL